MPDFDLDEPCWVCDKPIGEGDEAGAVQFANGDWAPICSEACTETFYNSDADPDIKAV